MKYEWQGADQALLDLKKKNKDTNKIWMVLASRAGKAHTKGPMTINDAITDALGKKKSGWKGVRIEIEGRL